jgi:hypothetical protein
MEMFDSITEKLRLIRTRNSTGEIIWKSAPLCRASSIDSHTGNRDTDHHRRLEIFDSITEEVREGRTKNSTGEIARNSPPKLPLPSSIDTHTRNHDSEYHRRLEIFDSITDKLKHRKARSKNSTDEITRTSSPTLPRSSSSHTRNRDLDFHRRLENFDSIIEKLKLRKARSKTSTDAIARSSPPTLSRPTSVCAHTSNGDEV